MNTSQKNSASHLDDLALDKLRAGESTPVNAAHVEGCPRCRASLAELAVLEDRLKAAQPGIPSVPLLVEARIFRAYRDAVARREPASFPALLRRWTLPVAGLAAAAAAVTLTLRLAPPTYYQAPSVAPNMAPPQAPPEMRIAAPAPASPKAREVAKHPPAPVALAPLPTPGGGLDAPRPTAAVDIVDAFRLARALRDGRQVAAGWDADGDGVVGGADVKALARRAVAL